VPFKYQEHVYVHALQWAIGLELFLLSKDPWRIVLSTDHPNGGSFMNYPKLIKLLMDSSFRREELSRANQKAINKTLLADLDREYSLNEIAIITRAGPARCLGLQNKGHLGIGADADITIYDDQQDKELMFNAPRYVFKSGMPIISNHEFCEDHTGRLLHVTPAYDETIVESVRPFFEDYYSIEFENYAVDDSYLHDHEIIPTIN
jgi:formylmethanofuran dehydrogenase subunit A